MKETPDGRRKIVDLIDASGSGDVDTSTVCEAVDGCLNGVTGRKLQVYALSVILISLHFFVSRQNGLICLTIIPLWGSLFINRFQMIGKILLGSILLVSRVHTVYFQAC